MELLGEALASQEPPPAPPVPTKPPAPPAPRAPRPGSARPLPSLSDLPGFSEPPAPAPSPVVKASPPPPPMATPAPRPPAPEPSSKGPPPTAPPARPPSSQEPSWKEPPPKPAAPHAAPLSKPPAPETAPEPHQPAPRQTAGKPSRLGVYLVTATALAMIGLAAWPRQTADSPATPGPTTSQTSPSETPLAPVAVPTAAVQPPTVCTLNVTTFPPDLEARYCLVRPGARQEVWSRGPVQFYTGAPGAYKLTLSARGYRPVEQEVQLDGVHHLAVSMEKLPETRK